MITFENYDRKIHKIQAALEKYSIKDLSEAAAICREAGFDPYKIVKGIQPICFEDACWAYTCLLYTSHHNSRFAGQGKGVWPHQHQ